MPPLAAMQRQIVALAVTLTLVATDLTVAQQPTAPRSFRPSTSVRDRLTAPLVTEEEGEIRVRMRDQRAAFDGSTMTLYPVFGRASEREWPIAVHVSSATVGSTALDVRSTGAATHDGATVRVPRRDLHGQHHLSLDGLEQTFVFGALPTRGEIVLTLDVTSELVPEVSGDSLRLSAGALGYVEVGAAFVFDAAGRRQPITREWIGGGIELRVPESFVADAVLPLTIDPVWSTFSSGAGIPDDAVPDVAYCGSTQEYVVVWEDYTSQSNSDCYAMRLDADLHPVGDFIIVEGGGDSWTDPAIAYSRATDQVLIAASVANGSSSARVMARPIDVGDWQLGSAFVVSTTGSTQKKSVDVGGTSSLVASTSRFCVVWTREVGPGDHDVEYHIVEPDGTSIMPRTVVDSSTEDDIQPSVSTGLGDTQLFGDNWHLVWTRDDDGDGLGEIWTRRIYYTGNPQLSSMNFSIASVDEYANPVATSTFDDPHLGGRPFLAFCERYTPDFTRPDGYQIDLVAITVIDDQYVSAQNVTALEDGTPALLQRHPRVATNGTSFLLTYLEEDPDALNQNRWNAYMCSGEVRRNALGTGPALAERHVPLATHAEVTSAPAIAGHWSGDATTNSTEALAVWSRDIDFLDARFGSVEGAGVRYLIPNFLSTHAVGEQYGSAFDNSTGTSGWLRILGDQDPTQLHLAQAVDLPLNSFGYLIVGTTSTSVANPAGSAGRLLVSGSLGRYVQSIQSSGQLGRMETVIDPTAIPQSNGTVAATAGQTYYFQMWHRDSVQGQATSNFTNGCRLRFVN